MISYKNCKDVSIEHIYKAFNIGFSDYFIKFDISKEVFIESFFGPEGNQLENSFIAYDKETPVGVILGGLKNYEGLKTLRCGTLCVIPSHRGLGISDELFRLHKKLAIVKECKQLFLEVIVGNDRAIKFYEKFGYEKVYDIKYFTCDLNSSFNNESRMDLEIKEIEFSKIRSVENYIKDIHINWQNDFDYMDKIPSLIHYGAYEGDALVGALSLNQNGKIFFIWVKSTYRNKGIGRNLLNRAIKENELEKLNIGFPNNSNLEGFLRRNNFKKDNIAQYEMYLTL